MLAGVARAAGVAAVAVPLLALAAPSASAHEPAAPNTKPSVNQPAVSHVDAPYIWVNICLHIPTPGSATLDWCWP